MSETQDEIDEREQYEPDEDAEYCMGEYEPEWVTKLKAKLSRIKLNLQLAYWTLKALHRHKWIITREEQSSMNPNEMIELERVCSECFKHQTDLLGDWVTTELSYEEIQKRLHEPYKKGKS